MIIAPGATDVTTYWKLIDPAAWTPETGLVIANLDATYVRDRAAAVKNDLSTPVGFTVSSAHTDNAAIEVDAVNAPGLYRVDFPDAAFAAGVARVQLVLNGAAIDPTVIEVELSPWITTVTGAGVLVGATQGAVTWDQQTISANVAGQGALHIVNVNAIGYGMLTNGSTAGQYNFGVDYGQRNQGNEGQHNEGNVSGQYNAGVQNGQYNYGNRYGQYNEGNDIMMGTGYGIGAYGGTDGILATGVAGYGIEAAGGIEPLSADMITAAAIATDAIDADALAPSAVDEIIDEPVEGAYTMRQLLRIMAAALAGESSGGATPTIRFRDVNDTKPRIVATVDWKGNRLAVVLDGT